LPQADHGVQGDEGGKAELVCPFFRFALCRQQFRCRGLQIHPARGDDEMLAQTRRLIEEALPLAAARWPKPRRHMPAE
jgi:hypothetical protein